MGFIRKHRIVLTVLAALASHGYLGSEAVGIIDTIGSTTETKCMTPPSPRLPDGSSGG